MTNLLALQASRRLDRVEELRTCTFWNVPSIEGFHPAKALEAIRKTGRVGAAWQTILTIAAGPVTVYRDGGWSSVNPADNPVNIVVPGNGTVTAYPLGTSEPVTLPRVFPEVRTVRSVWSLYPPQLNGLYHREAERITREGLNPADVTTSFLETTVGNANRWLQGPLGFPPGFHVWVEALGRKRGQPARVTCWPQRAPTSAVLTLVVGTLRVLRGDVTARGVVAPEACFEPLPFLEEAAQYVKQDDRDAPLLGERFEWLE